MNQLRVDRDGREQGSCLLLAFFSFCLFTCFACASGPTAQQIVHREFAISFLLTTGTYSPSTIDQSYAKAKEMLTVEGRANFLDSHFDAERLAVKASGREQVLEIEKETIEIEELDLSSSAVYIEAKRTRTVRGKTSAPVYLLYTVVVESAAQAGESPRVRQVKREPFAGQTQQLSEEALLERFNEASEAAAEERKEFLKTVGAVRKDLKEHEKKVEKDFKRLSDSLDKLGSTVRKLGQDVKEKTKNRQQPKRAKESADVPSVAPSPARDEAANVVSEGAKSPKQDIRRSGILDRPS